MIKKWIQFNESKDINISEIVQSQKKFRTSPFYSVFKRLEDYIKIVDEDLGILYYTCGGDSRYAELEKSIDLLKVGKDINTYDFMDFGIIIH